MTLQNANIFIHEKLNNLFLRTFLQTFRERVLQGRKLQNLRNKFWLTFGETFSNKLSLLPKKTIYKAICSWKFLQSLGSRSGIRSFSLFDSFFWSRTQSILGLCKISNAIMATWHTQNNKSKIRNTEQVICNGKTRKSGTGKTVWYGTRWPWKHEVFSTSQKWLPTKMSWWKHNIWWVIYNSVYDKIIWIS